MTELLGELIHQLSVFSNIHQSRVFGYLIDHPAGKSGKDISNDLEIADSKIYPALRELSQKGLVIKNDQERPHRYYLQPPEIIIDFLRKSLDNKIQDMELLMEQCIQLIYRGWNDTFKIDQKLDHVFRDTEIETQLIALSQEEFSSIKLILSSKFEKYLDSIMKIFGQAIINECKIELCIPNVHHVISMFEKYLTDSQTKQHITLKELQDKSLNNETYILLDKRLLFQISHQTIADFGYFSTDWEVISRIEELWRDGSSFSQFHRIFRSVNQ